MFYERVRDQVILNSIRYNGSNQQSYQISNPDFFPAIPAVSTLSASIQPQNLQLLSARFHAPRIHGLQLAVDRQINKSFRISVNYFHVRAEYLAQQRNINAPIPGTGIYPYGDRTVRMLTDSTGFNRFNQININPLVTYKKFTLFGTYLFAIGKTDSDGIGMDPYYLRAEWGPANFDVRHRVTIGPNFPIPFLKLTVSPLFNYNSGFPYNITTGLPDPSGDGFAVQRPALVQPFLGRLQRTEPEICFTIRLFQPVACIWNKDNSEICRTRSRHFQHDASRCADLGLCEETARCNRTWDGNRPGRSTASRAGAGAAIESDGFQI